MASTDVGLPELRTFCAAADLGSLGRAAIRLGVSQPALTKRIQALEQRAGAQLLARSARGVRLTPAGRRVYEEARRLLEQADVLDDLLAGLRRSGGPLRLAASHSSAEALVNEALADVNGGEHMPVELVTANSTVVRDLVADGRADVGVAASRPHQTPYPGVRQLTLAHDEIVCAVPLAHPWARFRRITAREFTSTPMVMRDPASNARWTVEAVLREHELSAPPALVEAANPDAARREALARNAPLLLSRNVLRGGGFAIVEVAGLSFPREYVVVLPAIGDPGAAAEQMIERLRAQVASRQTDAAVTS